MSTLFYKANDFVCKINNQPRKIEHMSAKFRSSGFRPSSFRPGTRISLLPILGFGLIFVFIIIILMSILQQNQYNDSYNGLYN
jgi:hypothetical protein